MVSQVCRRWRQIALRHSKVWSRLYIDVSAGCMLFSAVEEGIKHSAEFPLTIVLGTSVLGRPLRSAQIIVPHARSCLLSGA
ncbi:hypothetical protein BDV98DRAFT_574519 [Pterulicium gracile]|uniref:F-box domain-containing protein n=1 Tax=Pterulicium gracile TaxID=1884261 RepID=A0A5C3Q5T2_9AGAR|nr:hypothetical protein BDV98DRAFT_574519 [Pterula gracilis]